MCRLQVINCINVSCTNSCAIGVVFCDAVIARYNGKITEYYLLREAKVRVREGCSEHSFLPNAKSDHHACFDCDPISFKMMEKDLAANNENIAKVLYRGFLASIHQKLSAAGPSGPQDNSQPQGKGQSVNQQLLQCLKNIESYQSPGDIVMTGSVTELDLMEID